MAETRVNTRHTEMMVRDYKSKKSRKLIYPISLRAPSDNTYSFVEPLTFSPHPRRLKLQAALALFVSFFCC